MGTQHMSNHVTQSIVFSSANLNLFGHGSSRSELGPFLIVCSRPAV